MIVESNCKLCAYGTGNFCDLGKHGHPYVRWCVDYEKDSTSVIALPVSVGDKITIKKIHKDFDESKDVVFYSEL